MSCFYPLWIESRSEKFKVGCGRCRGCRLDRAKDWALRCVHEASMHDENCYVTLTFNEDHIPSDGSVRKRHMQLFMKRLRKSIAPDKVRFYGCGEYGENMGRPHYHICLFGYDFPDKELLYVSNKKNRFSLTGSYPVFTSDSLGELWKEGYHTISEVNVQSAGYVARYVTKKIGGAMAKDHYRGRRPEFALMSRNPGIGSEWIRKYMYDLYPKDFVTEEGKKFRAPRFYDNRLMRHCYAMYEDVKSKRIENVREDDCVRRRQKEKYLTNVTKILERSFEKHGE